MVVLPLPAPPLTMMFARPRTLDSRNRIVRGPHGPLATRPAGVMGTSENFLIVSVGPRSERDGTIAWTRAPPCSRAPGYCR
jgi:hypothetical protein